jgi:PelA/Pel-15E family pectate lyase
VITALLVAVIIGQTPSAVVAPPRLHTHRGDLLRVAKERIRAGDPALLPALTQLQKSADSVFALGPYTVTHKRRVPPSGDKRDYVSYAPYWWPDSTKPGGLPYIRRDGQFNMELRRESDVLRWYAMTDAVETLTQAYYFTDRAEYASRAAHLLRVWFLNDSTRMNPHLRYGQAILGVTDGRGIGIIDTRDLDRVFDAVHLLEGSATWTADDVRGMRDWARRYLDWLLTSENGKEEAAAANNHGTWYDVQVVALRLFLGDTARARETLEQSRANRIAKQIDAAGRQPLELARTRSLHYSVENLEGMSRLAEMGRVVGVDLWAWNDGGRGIRKAIDFVAPYADPRVKWPHDQITEEPADLFVLLLLRARTAFGDPSYAKRLEALPADLVHAHRARLLYPEPSLSAAQSSDSLLAAARIMMLPAAQQNDWRAYLERSRANRKKDLDSINAELRAAGLARWTAAPVGPGFATNRTMTPDWFKTAEAAAIADAIVSYQTPTGGWSKRVDFTRTRARGESFGSDDSWNWIGTLDNNSTTEQILFLAGAHRAHGKAAYRRSYERGIDYLLTAQFPNGCWPQIYPLEGGYHDAVTFNDDATIHALQVLRALAIGQHEFAPQVLRDRAGAAVNRGIDCITRSQVSVNGRKTVWGAQHDPLTLAPVKARAYEHASLSGRESAAILDFLLRTDSPGPAVIQAVHAAAAWFRASAINGFTYAPRGRLVPQSGGGPLWARFYEIDTNRPIFSDRDGVIKYSLDEIGEERRTGYLWYTDEPVASLRRYDAWARRYPIEKN